MSHSWKASTCEQKRYHSNRNWHFERYSEKHQSNVAASNALT